MNDLTVSSHKLKKHPMQKSLFFFSLSFLLCACDRSIKENKPSGFPEEKQIQEKQVESFEAPIPAIVEIVKPKQNPNKKFVVIDHTVTQGKALHPVKSEDLLLP